MWHSCGWQNVTRHVCFFKHWFYCFGIKNFGVKSNYVLKDTFSTINFTIQSQIQIHYSLSAKNVRYCLNGSLKTILTFSWILTFEILIAFPVKVYNVPNDIFIERFKWILCCASLRWNVHFMYLVMLQSVSRIWKSLSWLKFVIVVL